ncbi:MAG: glucose-1-phosphate cytidylyltransferase [Candidatus Thermoplasmatota archaeon]|nr:glucose-1-phosphate cytidylyltransferase [Candidatus Thermoplasmatota archaeon]
MKVAILAGGLGTRLTEETIIKPKPMVEIGGRPILWHIMTHYSYFGFNEFIIALGYKGEYIKSWMNDYFNLKKNIVVEKNKKEFFIRDMNKDGWAVHLVDTGQKTQTGGRIKRLAPWLDDHTFMLTWCDAVANINLQDLLNFHFSHGKLATVTAVRPKPRFGHLVIKKDAVTKFKEKSLADEAWINGAFFVLEPEIFDYIDGDDTQWEKEPLENLAKNGQLMAFKHKGFWQCMDTIHEKNELEKMWDRSCAPWKLWKG